MLQVTGLAKRFRHGTVQAVRGVNFSVAAGSFFTLLGPSGCGKTTIMRCVAGLEPPDAGEIRIQNQVVFSAATRLSVPPELRPVGMVFQSYAIWPHMTVFENAAFPLRHARPRLPATELRRRVLEMLERLGLAAQAHHWATQLSGGQQQRLALARSLLRGPALLLLDEPLSNLDAKLRKTLRRELKAFQRDFGVTTLYVTHDQAEALAMSDRIAVLRAGSIEQIGTPREIYERPATQFVAGFVGDANLFSGRPTPGGASVICTFGELACQCGGCATEGPEVQVSIRPENVLVSPDAPPQRLNAFWGHVVSVDFVGDALECMLRVGSVEVRSRLAPGEAIQEGDPVWVSLPKEHCTVIPSEQAGREGDAQPIEGAPKAMHAQG